MRERYTISFKPVMSFGVVDMPASIALAKSALEAHVEYLAAKPVFNLDQGLVATAVEEFFNLHPGKTIPMPRVISSITLQQLNLSPGAEKQATIAIQQYLRSNSGTFESGAMFKIARGVKGGVTRWFDVAPK